MIRTVILDSGPLGLSTNPKKLPETIQITQWTVAMMAAGHKLVVLAIADYEVRRELKRAGKLRGIALLDAWNRARHDRYLALTDQALSLAPSLWAHARNAGTPTADPKELDGDVLIAAQALSLGLSTSQFIIATVNVGHLAQFAPADIWQNITP